MGDFRQTEDKRRIPHKVCSLRTQNPHINYLLTKLFSLFIFRVSYIVLDSFPRFRVEELKVQRILDCFACY